MLPSPAIQENHPPSKILRHYFPVSQENTPHGGGLVQLIIYLKINNSESYFLDFPFIQLLAITMIHEHLKRIVITTI